MKFSYTDQDILILLLYIILYFKNKPPPFIYKLVLALKYNILYIRYNILLYIDIMYDLRLNPLFTLGNYSNRNGNGGILVVLFFVGKCVRVSKYIYMCKYIGAGVKRERRERD